MKGIVLELQASALDESISVEELLRKAYLVARKLQLSDFQKWVEDEQNGYKMSEVPEYRHIRGQYKALNPMGGWIPVMLRPKMEEVASIMPINYPLSQIENLYKKNSGTISFSPNASIQQLLNKNINFPLETVFIYDSDTSELYRILSIVRNKILEGAILLEENGIIGQELSFTDTEKQIARKNEGIIQYINNIYGNVDSANFLQ